MRSRRPSRRRPSICNLTHHARAFSSIDLMGHETPTSGPSGLAATSGSSCIERKAVSCSVTLITTMTPIGGRSAGKLETHPRTGAAQLVEVREIVEEVPVPVYVPVAQQVLPERMPFADLPDDQLLSYGVPVEWLPDIHAADEDGILELASHLPNEAAEALLELAVGETPQVPSRVPVGVNPFDHPDAQRRFRTMRDREELERALDYPWEKWAVFLHPAQREIVERDFFGPARVSGSAGTGKTIVALHRGGTSSPREPQLQGVAHYLFRGPCQRTA